MNLAGIGEVSHVPINLHDGRSPICLDTADQGLLAHHVLKFHPIRRGQLAKVKATLTDPDAIYQSKRNKDSHLYFKSYMRLPAGNQYILVVVGSRRGYVQTSFPVQNLSKGGRPLWKRS